MDEKLSLEQLRQNVESMKKAITAIERDQLLIKQTIMICISKTRELGDNVGKELEKRDKVIGDIIGLQRTFGEAMAPIIKEYRQIEAERLRMVFRESDRGLKFDN